MDKVFEFHLPRSVYFCLSNQVVSLVLTLIIWLKDKYTTVIELFRYSFCIHLAIMLHLNQSMLLSLNNNFIPKKNNFTAEFFLTYYYCLFKVFSKIKRSDQYYFIYSLTIHTFPLEFIPVLLCY